MTGTDSGFAHELAIQTAYLVVGVEQVLQTHSVKQALTDCGDHPICVAGGHLGMVADMVSFAERIVKHLENRLCPEYSGVPEYEITEPMGVWLAKNWQVFDPKETIIQAFDLKLEQLCSEFFTPMTVPV